MTVDNIFTTRFARNPLISRVLTEVRPSSSASCPAVACKEQFLAVVLYNGKTAANNVQTTENTTQKTTEKIIRILKERPYATAGQLAEELGLTVDGVDYNIRKLKKQGRIVRIGGDQGGHWEINEK